MPAPQGPRTLWLYKRQLLVAKLEEGPGPIRPTVAPLEGDTLPEASPAHGKTAVDGKVTAYVCLGPQCSLPVTEPAKLVETIRTARDVVVP